MRGSVVKLVFIYMGMLVVLLLRNTYKHDGTGTRSRASNGAPRLPVPSLFLFDLYIIVVIQLNLCS